MNSLKKMSLLTSFFVMCFTSKKKQVKPIEFIEFISSNYLTLTKSHSFGGWLSPVHFRRKNALLVSYYALF